MNVRNDDGLTLVELLVTIVVSGLFLGLLAVLFTNGITAQRNATARDHATGQANVLSASLAQSVRNATAINVRDDGLRLDATVALSTGGWQCRSWALNGTDLVYSAGASAQSTSTAGWTPIVEADVAGTLIAGAAFAREGDRGVTIGIRITQDGQTATVSDGVTSQAFTTGAPACF